MALLRHPALAAVAEAAATMEFSQWAAEVAEDQASL